MKKAFLALMTCIGLIFPFACGENNPAPVRPVAPSGATNTPSGATFTPTGTLPTATFTPTATPTGILNTPTFTYTPTSTWTLVAPPPYLNNYGTSAAPNGMYYDPVNQVLLVAEAENNGSTIINGLETFNVLSSGQTLTLQNLGNLVIKGGATPYATPNATPWSGGTTFVVSYPMGVATSNNSWGVLDNQLSGGATLYMANFNVYPYPVFTWGGPFENFTDGFGGAKFNNPRCLTADSLGNFYVADTGNGYIDEFDGGGYDYGSSPGWLHRWNGDSSSTTFIKPVALACDNNNYVYIGDAGTIPSQVQVYTSGGTTLLGKFSLIAGCKINGLTVDNAGDFFVSDTNNGEVEEYQIVGGLVPGTVATQANLIRSWGDPHSYHEFQPYTPSCLQFINNYIVVGDTGNDFLNIFGP